jgi:pimeloyl-ACP methyl ester carboxylesterase
MTAQTVSRAGSAEPTAEVHRRGRVGLVVLGSIASGLAIGVLLVLVVFDGGEEAEITGSALIALGAGFMLLAALSSRLTDMPQRWALVPAVALFVAGGTVVLLSPGDRALGLAGWVWPGFVLMIVVWSVRGARRSLPHWSRRGVLYPALVVLLLVAIGGSLETVTEATSGSPMPSDGRTYLANGHDLYLDCDGTGAPTVVLFNGLGERTPSWARVQDDLSSSTRICVFDRAGQGWSGSAPGPQDGHELASDLQELLRAARVPPPYVLAGHSTGGTYALVYAERYPRDVAGVALIDSATPYQFDLPEYPAFYSTFRRVSALLPSLARTGIARLALGSGFASSPRELRSNRTEFLMLPAVFGQAKALTSLEGKPLAVLTADVGQQRGWTAAQSELARLSTNSTQQTAHGATHEALLEDRRFAAITSRAIIDVVRAAREPGQP